jgi:WD40 repeat protein
MSAAFSPDGARIVTASNDHTARIWDATTGAEIKVLRGHKHWVDERRLLPQRRPIVTASIDARRGSGTRRRGR